MRRFVLVLAILFGSLAAMTGPAAADHAPDFGQRWQTILTPSRHFTPSVPTGQWRDRINDGMNQWNQLAESVQYAAAPDLPDRDPDVGCPTTEGIVTMHRANIDDGGGFAGLSGYCYYTAGGTGRHSAWIIFDESEEWCLGTGDCYSGLFGTGIGADIDLWSIATHEWGHVGALGHYAGTDTICGNNDQHATMCPSTRPGTERDRSLELHDTASYRARY